MWEYLFNEKQETQTYNRFLHVWIAKLLNVRHFWQRQKGCIVTSFSSISYCSNREHWSQKRSQTQPSIYNISKIGPELIVAGIKYNMPQKAVCKYSGNVKWKISKYNMFFGGHKKVVYPGFSVLEHNVTLCIGAYQQNKTGFKFAVWFVLIVTFMVNTIFCLLF